MSDSPYVLDRRFTSPEVAPLRFTVPLRRSPPDTWWTEFLPWVFDTNKTWPHPRYLVARAKGDGVDKNGHSAMRINSRTSSSAKIIKQMSHLRGSQCVTTATFCFFRRWSICNQTSSYHSKYWKESRWAFCNPSLAWFGHVHHPYINSNPVAQHVFAAWHTWHTQAEVCMTTLGLAMSTGTFRDDFRRRPTPKVMMLSCSSPSSVVARPSRPFSLLPAGGVVHAARIIVDCS